MANRIPYEPGVIEPKWQDRWEADQTFFTKDLAQLEERSVLSDPSALADIRGADAADARGDVVHGIDTVRHLRG